MSDSAHVEELAAVLAAGGLAVVPTDTVYGLAARATDPSATAALFAAKGRRGDTPIAVLCADARQALELCADPCPSEVSAVAIRWWPGPLTLVVPRRPGLSLDLGRPRETIGLRVPDHHLLQAVAQEVGPIATTSANRHGEPTPEAAADAAASLHVAPALVVDGGRLRGTASTVLDTTTWPWRVLREGDLRADAVLATAAAARTDAG